MHRAIFLAIAFSVLCALSATAPAAVYQVQLNSGEFGAVKQSDVPAADGTFGPTSCTPTATADAFAWLQQAFPGVYGSSLVGSGTYSTIESTGATLASNTYMRTTAASGTFPALWVSGEVGYLEHASPGATSYGGMGRAMGVNTVQFPWFVNADPTFSFLYNALEENAAVELGMFSASGGIGHVLALTGLSWNDANGNGMMDLSEGATMTFVDPEDGLTKTSDIWQLTLGGTIQTDYYQAGQDSGTLVMATSEVPVPEPSSLLLASLAPAVLVARRRSADQPISAQD